jgi:CRP-like cAMP-binding protein
MREAQYALGDTIFRANEVSKHLYIIVSGAAERWLEVGCCACSATVRPSICFSVELTAMPLTAIV